MEYTDLLVAPLEPAVGGCAAVAAVVVTCVAGLGEARVTVVAGLRGWNRNRGSTVTTDPIV